MVTPSIKTSPKAKAKTKATTSKPEVESRDSPSDPTNGAANPTNGAGGAIISPILSLDPKEFILTNSGLVDDDKFEDILASVAIRKPNPLEFFRTCPDEKTHDHVAILDYDDKKYMVTKNMVAAFNGDVRIFHLMTCVNQAGLVFLWDRKTGNNSWNNSGQAAAVKSLKNWVRIKSNRELLQYDVIVGRSTVAPQWPKENLIQLMAIAFGNNVISDDTHDVFKHLMGK